MISQNFINVSLWCPNYVPAFGFKLYLSDFANGQKRIVLLIENCHTNVEHKKTDLSLETSL